ncbi:MAG TPA: ethanolamine ammonia-lyase subunit EutC [Stellaceae bacterium]|nr:ethanolamine ammonia-lyase subunit EutC [Stellaceae bacterium]
MTGAVEVSWPVLRRLTSARVGLQRTGTALTTADHLDFQLAHARARDAVYAPLEAERIVAGLGGIGFDSIRLCSAAADRLTYLRRPDLGRRLDARSRRLVAERPQAAIDVAFVIADGLSATAVNAHAVALLESVQNHSGAEMARVGPVAVVEGGRVAIGDEIGGLLGAALVAVLIGERPGLSSADSMGVYVTWQPAPGAPDAARNCLSNIRPQGRPIADGAKALLRLFAGARHYRMTGVELSRRLAEIPAVPSG